MQIYSVQKGRIEYDILEETSTLLSVCFPVVRAFDAERMDWRNNEGPSLKVSTNKLSYLFEF